MSETSRTRDLCKKLRERRGMESYPLIASQWAPPGWPDRLFSHKLFGLALVEFKDFNTRVTPLQYRRLREIQRACVCRFDATGNLVRLETENATSEWFEWLRLPEALKVFFHED